MKNLSAHSSQTSRWVKGGIDAKVKGKPAATVTSFIAFPKSRGPRPEIFAPHTPVLS